MMPGESGLEFTQSLRQTSAVPILMLTARAEIPHRIRGLEVGADDYLPKPFEPRELLLRISAILKRGTKPPPAVQSIRFGPFTFHVERGELKRDGRVVRITDRERDILRIFAGKPGETVRRHEFLRISNGGGERAVDVQMNRLRRKLEADPSNPVYLQTTRGIGYRLLVD
jgi:two-component system phosphate regulon response regulator OmpR